MLSKQKPLSVDETIPGHPDPESIKGRIVTLEFESCYLVGTYVVNAGQGLKVSFCHTVLRGELPLNLLSPTQTLEEKKIWNKHFFAYMNELDKKKPIIWAGDLNVAPTALDLANPKTNWNKTAGYTEAETSAFKNFLDASKTPGGNKFLDIWRTLHPEQRAYTYFSYRFNCRAKGLGWRIDGCMSSISFKFQLASLLVMNNCIDGLISNSCPQRAL